MRKLMWFTIGLAACLTLCAYTMPHAPLIAVGGVSIVLFALAVWFSFRWKWLRCVAVMCAGSLIGLWLFLGFQLFFITPISHADGTRQSLTLTATDYSYETDYGIGVDVSGQINGRHVRMRAYLDGDLTLTPGDQVTGTFRLRLTSPGAQKEASYYAASGVFLLAYQTGDIQYTPGTGDSLLYFPQNLKARIQAILAEAFSGDTFPFVKALLLGDTEDISYELDTAFKISGIRHIIAVSGMHVSVLYGLLHLLALRRRYLTAILTLPVLVLFAAMAGFTPSVTRACIMVGLMVLAQAVNREYDAPTALSFACLVMLCVNPLVITSVSFQLSVGCVAGILLFSNRIQAWFLQRAAKWKRHKLLYRGMQTLGLSLSVTLGAMSLTTPLSALYFGSVSLVGLIGNLLTLWAVNLLFNGIVVTALVSLISGTAGSILGSILAWVARYVTGAATLLSRLPLAAVYTQSIYIVIWLIFLYLLLAVFLIQKRKKPGTLLCFAVIGLCLALLASWAEPLMSPCRLTVLDVGQGQAILIQSEGRTVLIDCGGSRDKDAADLTAQTLLSQGIRSIDALILTHGDRDHAGGAGYFLGRIPAAKLILPGNLDSEEADALGTQCSGGTIPVSQPLSMTVGSSRITVYPPPFVEESNENSLCILLESENLTALITGDRSGFGERLLLREYALPDVDVLIAGHHGSKHATCQELLDAVTPETVIISVGADNGYGHPAPELLERLEAFGCQILRTDRMGTIVVKN